MENQKEHFRHILLFYFHKGKTASQAHQKLRTVYGDEALKERQCQNWFAKFRSGDFSLKDEKRSGRPVEDDDALIKAIIDSDRHCTTREVAKKPPKNAKDPKKILLELKQKKEKLKEMEQSGEAEKAQEMKEKQAWNSVLAKASGEKVKDDPELLKRSISRKEQKKKHSAKKMGIKIGQCSEGNSRKAGKATRKDYEKEKGEKVEQT